MELLARERVVPTIARRGGRIELRWVEALEAVLGGDASRLARVLRQLGAPAAWRGAGSPAEALAPIVAAAAAAERARSIALSELREEPAPATRSPRRAKPRRKRRRG